MSKYSIDELVEWVESEYPIDYPIDLDKLEENIVNNVLNGWIPYIKWYNKMNPNKKISEELLNPKILIRDVFKFSLVKLEIAPPKIGEDLKLYWLESIRGDD